MQIPAELSVSTITHSSSLHVLEVGTLVRNLWEEGEVSASLWGLQLSGTDFLSPSLPGFWLLMERELSRELLMVKC